MIIISEQGVRIKTEPQISRSGTDWAVPLEKGEGAVVKEDRQSVARAAVGPEGTVTEPRGGLEQGILKREPQVGRTPKLQTGKQNALSNYQQEGRLKKHPLSLSLLVFINQVPLYSLFLIINLVLILLWVTISSSFINFIILWFFLNSEFLSFWLSLS